MDFLGSQTAVELNADMIIKELRERELVLG